MKYKVDVNNPLEDPYVYYTDEQGRKLKAKIELVKGGFWGRKGKMKLYLESFTNWDNSNIPLTLNEYQTTLKRIIKDLNEHDLLVDLA
jgi:hypothetical protein